MLAALAVIAAPLSRGLAPALVGTRAGIDRWIEWTAWASAVLTQLMVWGALVLVTSLIVTTLRKSELSLSYRLLVVPASAVVATLTVLATRDRLDARANVMLAWASAAATLAAAAGSLRSPPTRVLGLALCGAGLAGSLGAVGGALAVQGGSSAPLGLVESPRTMATLSFVLEVLVVGMLAARLGRAWPARYSVLTPALLVLSALVSFCAWRGSQPDASLFEVLCSRALGELVRYPAPSLSPHAVVFVEVFAHVLAFAALVVPASPRWLGPPASLLLVARGLADVPALALLLVVAAMTIRLLEADERSQGPSAPNAATSSASTSAPANRPVIT